MDIRKLKRFDRASAFLACPVCGEPLVRDGRRLACQHGHSFDIARQGYVNLLRGGGHGGAGEDYGRHTFEMRRRVFDAGLYDPIAQTVAETAAGIVGALGERPAVEVVDAGCGEGFFSRAVRGAGVERICAFDISKDSVQLAAGADPADGVAWAVADLAAIPVLDRSAGVVLNVFSPANYREFDRVLAPGGRVVKVIPTENHLREVRRLAADKLRHGAYSNKRIIEHFGRFCTICDRRTVSATIPLEDDVREALVSMTPILFNVDAAEIDWSGLTEATAEAEILVGTMR